MFWLLTKEGNAGSPVFFAGMGGTSNPELRGPRAPAISSAQHQHLCVSCASNDVSAGKVLK